MPAALIEIGFLSNAAERARLVDSTYQETIAQAIYQGIVAYLDYADSAFPDS
jgi:N-acetylmuramoyl-L-alanine amidase